MYVPQKKLWTTHSVHEFAPNI